MRPEDALRQFASAERTGKDPDLCAAGRWICHMLIGNFDLAWRESDAIARRGRPDPNRFWDGRPLKGRDVLLRCLHGLGDTIQFIRFTPFIREHARTLTVEAQPPLAPLLKHSQIADRVITWGEPEPHWDQQIEVMELPRIFRVNSDSIPHRVPYLQAPGASLPHDRSRQLRVGLVWKSGDYNPARSIPMESLAELFSIQEASFFSLQDGAWHPELAPWSTRVTVLDDVPNSVFATAMAIASLDLVISVDTMVAHLAGALARPVWTLLPYQCDWRWMLHREDSPWYPTMRLFRQSRSGDWNPVIQRVAKELRTRVDATRQCHPDRSTAVAPPVLKPLDQEA
jgi:hypothetical protein